MEYKKYWNAIVPFEVARLLKEAGFPQVTHWGYYGSEKSVSEISTLQGSVHLVDWNKEGAKLGDLPTCAAPTYADATDWILNHGVGFRTRLLLTDSDWANWYVDMDSCIVASVNRIIEKQSKAQTK